MLTQKKDLYDAIEKLHDELLDKNIDYIEYLKYSYLLNDGLVPERLVVKDRNDFIEKLEKGERDIEASNVSSVKDVFASLEMM